MQVLDVDQSQGAAMDGAEAIEGSVKASAQKTREDSAAEIEEFEPDQPLHGLARRMKMAKIDEESMNVIKAKLVEAQEKVKL